MNGSIQLRGITWDHSRALPPLVATAQRFEETHPGVRIEWRKRTLHEFGHQNIKDLAHDYDLVVIDHPWAGFALDENIIHDLRPLVPQTFLDDLRDNSVGPSFSSYEFRDSLIALPIDGATPASSYRPDLLNRAGVAVPQTWNDVLALARRGLVALPGFHVDQLLNLIGLCTSLGGRVFDSGEQWVDPATGRQALEMMRELVAHVPAIADDWNPIRVYEELASGDRFAYCPFAYTYSNYARRGFAKHRLAFTDLVAIPGHGNFRSVLGGTGIAISRRCQEIEIALEYSQFVASADCQRTLYVENGGQPAHRKAWLDEDANRITGNFFRSTLRSMDEAYVRPRYNGALSFQESAGEPLVRFYREGGSADALLDVMNGLYRQSRKVPTE